VGQKKRDALSGGAKKKRLSDLQTGGHKIEQAGRPKIKSIIAEGEKNSERPLWTGKESSSSRRHCSQLKYPRWGEKKQKRGCRLASLRHRRRGFGHRGGRMEGNRDIRNLEAESREEGKGTDATKKTRRTDLVLVTEMRNPGRHLGKMGRYRSQ